MDARQYEKVKSSRGFIAALDQSGGSTPKALSLYGIKPEAYSGDQQMFDLMHAMRTRIVKSPAFDGNRVLAAICSSKPWIAKSTAVEPPTTCGRSSKVVPFVKVDKGLADEANGVQLMKEMPNLDALLRAPRPEAYSAPRCARSSIEPTPRYRARRRSAVHDRQQILRRASCPSSSPR
jgi:fructose-bisphosphate aldolase class I